MASRTSLPAWRTDRKPANEPVLVASTSNARVPNIRLSSLQARAPVASALRTSSQPGSLSPSRSFCGGADDNGDEAASPPPRPVRRTVSFAEIEPASPVSPKQVRMLATGRTFSCCGAHAASSAAPEVVWQLRLPLHVMGHIVEQS